MEPPPLPESLTDRVAFLLQLAVSRAQQMGEKRLVELELTGREYGMLALLQRGATSAQHQLGAVLGMDRTTTMKLVAGLAARGLVQRERDPANLRAYLIALSPAGERLRARAASALAECDDQFLSRLSDTERRQLRRILGKLR